MWLIYSTLDLRSFEVDDWTRTMRTSPVTLTPIRQLVVASSFSLSDPRIDRLKREQKLKDLLLFRIQFILKNVDF